MKNQLTNELLHFKEIDNLKMDEVEEKQYRRERGAKINGMISYLNIQEDDLRFSYLKKGEFHFIKIHRGETDIEPNLPNVQSVYIDKDWK